MPVQVQCTIQDAWGWCTGTIQREGMQVAKYWSFSFSISSSSEYSELISSRFDWFDLLAVQWTLKSLLQHHSPKA